MAKPVKAYEYLAHEIPVIATEGTGIGDFVTESGIGWSIDYSVEAIQNKLKEILDNPELLTEKRKQCALIKKENTWKCRARQVGERLGRHEP